MLRQHRRFLSIHEADDFVREYMEAIGHHEFGKGLRPVNFGDSLDSAPPPGELAFWVRYWTVAYWHVLAHAGPAALLLSYAQLTEAPEPTLARLAEALRVPAHSLVAQAGQLHPPRHHPADPSALPAPLVQETRQVYEALGEQAL